MEAAQAVARLQAADERRSRAATVDDEPDTATTGSRTTSTIVASDMMVAIQYLQYANAAFDDELDVPTTFETFRPVVQTTEV